MKNKLDQYFELFRTGDPVVEMKQVKQILGSPRPSAPFLNKTTLVISGAAIIVCASFVLYLNTLPEETRQQKSSLTQEIATEKLSENITLKSFEKSEGRSPITTQNPDNGISQKSNNDTSQSVTTIGEPDQNKMEWSRDVQQFQHTYSQSEALNIIEPTNSELFQLGITTDGKMLYFTCHSQLRDSNPISNQEGVNLKLDSSRFKISISSKGKLFYAIGVPADAPFLQSPAKYTPVAVQIVIDGSDDPFIPFVAEQISGHSRQEFLKDVEHMLIGVKVHLIRKHNSAYKELIFWYKPTFDFRMQFSDDFRNSTSMISDQFNNDEYRGIVTKYTKQDKEPAYRRMITTDLVKRINHNAITLNRDELKELHIKSDDYSFRYKSTFTYKGKPCRLELVKDTANESYSISYDSKHLLSLTSEDKAIFPLAMSDTSMQLLNIYEIVEPENPDHMSQSELDKRKYENFVKSISDLIAVKLTYQNSKWKESRLLWFPKTPAVKEIIESHYTKLSIDKGVDLRGIRIIEADSLTMAKLHVVRGIGTISSPTLMSKNSNVNMEYSLNGSSTSFTTIDKEVYYKLPTEERGDSLKISMADAFQTEMTLYFRKYTGALVYPESATDEFGKHFYFFPIDLTNDSIKLTDADYKYMRENGLSVNTYPKAREIFRRKTNDASLRATSHLIPVLVTSERKDSKTAPFKMLLWYAPSKEFLQLLPADMASEIQSEYSAILNNQPAPSCTYFEACKNIKGKIVDYLVYPNPVKDELHLSITLEEERLLSITLNDISGKTIRVLDANKRQTKGESEYIFNINNVSEGIYLLTIETDKGERIIQRIIHN